MNCMDNFIKKTIKLASTVLIISFLTSTASASQLLPPDEAFLKKAEAIGITQEHWDSPEFAAVTFPNAYRFTRYYRISCGLLGSGEDVLAPEVWKGDGTSLDIKKLKGNDADGPIDLETLLRDRLKNHSMVVLKSDRLLHQHFWNGLDENSTHLDMSVTKSFTAILAGLAASEGKLDMTKPIESYLPEFKNTAFEGVPVQDAADMVSGLDIQTPKFLSWDPRFTQSQEWNGPNDSGLRGISEYLRTIKNRKYAIGTHYQYQDPNTEILGLVTEAAIGQGIHTYLQERIWKRVGMENDAFWMADPTGFVVASGGLNITTRDLARFGRLMLNDGKNYVGEQVVPKAFIDAVWQGNDKVRSAWRLGKEAALAPDGWYKDQIRILDIKGHRIMVFIGIHGQVLVMEKATGIVIAMNGGYPQTETHRMNAMLFLEVVPAILDASKEM
ncbi:MAG: beta-lactamase family protein [Desulfobacterales bacterium]|nr:beta-lactamase family protein [Desulfobacterales bacterium]